jgi:uncharacterized protein (TIGR01777 family)
MTNIYLDTKYIAAPSPAPGWYTRYMKRILIVGVTGTIGSALASALITKGYEVSGVSRHPEKARLAVPGLRESLLLDTKHPNLLIDPINQADAVISFTGAPLIGRPFKKNNPLEIRDSRIGVTHYLANSIAAASSKPEVFISASAIGYYGNHELTDDKINEASPCGEDSLSMLVAEWEAATKAAEQAGVRIVLARTGLLLNTDPSGALSQLTLPFSFFLGGPVGIPQSWRAWIHMKDEVGLLMHALETPSLSGPLNLVSPNPKRASAFSRALGQALHKPSWLPIPEATIRLAYGENAEIITRGKRIIPTKALENGYHFIYPHLPEALQDLLNTDNRAE